MKILKTLLIFAFLWTSNLSYGQLKLYDFNILAYAGIGFSTMENDNAPNYSLNSNNTEILLKYRFTYKFGLATGVGLNALSGNGFNSLGNFYHEGLLLKIPLVAILDYTITDNFSVVPNFGVYSQTIIKDEYRFLNDTQKNLFGGWSFGAQLGVGFTYKISRVFNVGFNYSLQYDFTKFVSNTNQTLIVDKQKLGKLNTVGIVLVMEL